MQAAPRADPSPSAPRWGSVRVLTTPRGLLEQQVPSIGQRLQPRPSTGFVGDRIALGAELGDDAAVDLDAALRDELVRAARGTPRRTTTGSLFRRTSVHGLVGRRPRRIERTRGRSAGRPRGSIGSNGSADCGAGSPTDAGSRSRAAPTCPRPSAGSDRSFRPKRCEELARRAVEERAGRRPACGRRS
jgi:hypothetical protein